MMPRRLLAAAFRRRWRWLLAGLLLMLASLAAGLALLGLSGWLVAGSALAGMGLIPVIDIFTPGAGIRLAAIVRTVTRYGERLVTHQATFRLLADIRLQLFARLLERDEFQLRRLRRGDTLHRFTADVETLDHLFAGAYAPLAAAVALSLAVALGFALFAGGYAAIPVLALLAAGSGLAALAAIAGRRSSRRLERLAPELRARISEALEALENLQARDLVAWQRGRVARVSAAMITARARLERRDAIGQGLVTALGLAGAWGVLMIALRLHQAGALSAPAVVLMVLVMFGLTEVWQPLPAAWRRLVQCRVAGERIDGLYRQAPRLPQPSRPQPMPTGNRLVMAGVGFGYHADWPPLFEHLDLAIEAGERLAVTGPSGGGKTTLALLLMRQLDPDRGRVALDGCDLRRLDPAALRRRIGYLPQRPVVFRDTLAGNLRLARPGADESALIRCLQQAGLGPLLDGLPSGLASWVDEAGANLSGGELRRLALARLMLTDPGVVILDEPATGLDRDSARELAACLDRWLEGRTVVMIGHDPDWLPVHDRLLRLGES